MSLNVLILKSVGSCIDENGVTYPLQLNSEPDRDNGTHILDVDNQERWDSLSFEDYNLIVSVRIKIEKIRNLEFEKIKMKKTWRG